MCWHQKLLIALLLAILAIPVYLLITAPKCKRGHYEKVHHDESTYFIMVGKVMVPQHRDAYDSTDWFCDERCDKNDPAPQCK